MTKGREILRLSSLLAVAFILPGCQQAGQSNVDTVSAAPASSSPAVVADPTVDSTPALPKPQTNPPTEDSIIGYDRVIRRPIRTLPPASSTPRR